MGDTVKVESKTKDTKASTVHLKLLPLNDTSRKLYENHKTYHPGDSGLDLFIIDEVTVQPQESVSVKLGIKASAWLDGRNVSFMVMPRSSIWKTPLRLSNSIGLIDAGYRGEISALLDNIKSYPHTLKEGDRICQVVGFTGGEITFELADSLDETERGSGGIGSTHGHSFNEEKQSQTENDPVKSNVPAHDKEHSDEKLTKVAERPGKTNCDAVSPRHEDGEPACKKQRTALHADVAH